MWCRLKERPTLDIPPFAYRSSHPAKNLFSPVSLLASRRYTYLDTHLSGKKILPLVFSACTGHARLFNDSRKSAYLDTHLSAQGKIPSSTPRLCLTLRLEKCLHRPRPIVQRFNEVRLPGYSSVCPREDSPPRPRDFVSLCALRRGTHLDTHLSVPEETPFNDETLSGFQPKKFYLPGYSPVRRADSRLPPPLVARSGTSCHEEFHAFLGSGV
ncbi:unnamed protein product [Leuciscus chuanchicus]